MTAAHPPESTPPVSTPSETPVAAVTAPDTPPEPTPAPLSPESADSAAAIPPVDSSVQKPVKKWIFIASLTALLLLTVISTVALGVSALKERITRWDAVALAALFVIALLTTLASNEVIPWGKRSLAHWRQPRVLGTLGGALLLAFSALFSLMPLLSRKDELLRQQERGQYQSIGWVVPEGAARGPAGPEDPTWIVSGSVFLNGEAPRIDAATTLQMSVGSGPSSRVFDLTPALDRQTVGNTHRFSAAIEIGQIEGTLWLCLARVHPELKTVYAINQTFTARGMDDGRIQFVPASGPVASRRDGCGG